MFWENFSGLCSKKGESPNSVAAKLGYSSGSVTAWKQGRVPKYKTLEMIAKYFSVTVESLLKEDEKTPADDTASEEEVKVALFGGAEEVTDEMWEEVKRFAEFIKQKYKK